MHLQSKWHFFIRKDTITKWMNERTCIKVILIAWCNTSTCIFRFVFITSLNLTGFPSHFYHLTPLVIYEVFSVAQSTKTDISNTRLQLQRSHISHVGQYTVLFSLLWTASQTVTKLSIYTRAYTIMSNVQSLQFFNFKDHINFTSNYK